MKKLSKEKRDKLVMVGVATLVVVAGIWFLLIEGQKSTLVKLAARNAEEQKKLEAGMKVLETRSKVEHRLAETTRKLQAIEGQMVRGDMYDWVIQTLKAFKADYKDRIDIPNFSREVIGEAQLIPKFPYRAAYYNIRGTAYFHDLGRFIADLETRFPFARVQNIELEPASSSSSTATDDAEKLAFRFEFVALVNPGTK